MKEQEDICLNHNHPVIQQWFKVAGEEETYRQYIENDGVLPKVPEFTFKNVKQYFNNFIPSDQFEYENIKKILSDLPVGAQAAFWRNTFYFKDAISKEEANEELFHSVVSTILRPDQREELYKEGAKLFNVEERLKSFIALYPQTYNKLSEKEQKERVVEEHLADLFVKSFKDESALDKVSNFIKELFNILKGMFGFASNRDFVETVFNDIKSGKFKNSEIIYSENATPSTYLIKGRNDVGAIQQVGEAESKQVLDNLRAFYFDQKQKSDLSHEELIDKAIEVATIYYNDKNPVVAKAFQPTMNDFDMETLQVVSIENPDYNELIEQLNTRIKEIAPFMFDLIEEDHGDRVTDENAQSEYANLSEFNSANEKGFDNISGWLKMYISTVGNVVPIQVGNEMVDFIDVVDSNKIYYGVARALNNSQNDFERLIKLIELSKMEGNGAAKAFVNKLMIDVTGKKDESIIQEIENDYLNTYLFEKDASIINSHIALDRSFILQNVLKGFDLWSNTPMIQTVSPETGASSTFNENINNSVNTQLANWQQNVIDNNSSVDILEDLITVIPLSDFYVDLNNAVTENLIALNDFGINISPETIKWLMINNSINAYGIDKLKLNANDIIKYNAFKSEIHSYGSKAEINSLLTNIQAYSSNVEELFTYTGLKKRLTQLAQVNAVFDENVFESSYKTADGKTRYGFQWKTFHLEFINNLQKSDHITSLMNNGLISYKVDDEGNDVYLKEGMDFLHNNILLKKFFDKEGDKYVLKENSVLPYIKMVQASGLRQVKDDAIEKEKKKLGEQINKALKKGNKSEVNRINKKLNEINEQYENVTGREGTGVTFSNILTKDFDLWRLNSVVNKTLEINGENMYLHYIGNLEAKRTADLVYLPEIKQVVDKDGLTQKGADLLKEEVRKEYDRIKRVHQEFKEVIEKNNIEANADGEINLTSQLLRDLTGKDVYEKFHTGTLQVDSSGISSIYKSLGVRALEFSDSVNGILPKEYMQNALTTAALNNTPLDEVWNDDLLKDHWNFTILKEHREHVQELLPNLDARWKIDGFLNNQKLNNYVVSSYLNVLAFNQMIHGDPALVYKNDGADMYKRFGGRNAAIQSIESYLVNPDLGITQVKNKIRYVTGEEFKSLVAFQPFQTDKDGNILKDKKGKTKGNSIDQADGQNYATTEYKRYLLWSRGKLTKFLAQALNDIELGYELTTAQRKVMFDNKEFFNVDKTVAFNGLQYMKKSDFMLTKEFTSYLSYEAEQLLKGLDKYDERAIKIRQDENNWIANPDVEFHHNLRQTMEGWRRGVDGKLTNKDKNKHKFDLYMPVSASKMLNINVYNPKTGWNNIDGSIIHISAKNYGLQLENPGGKMRIIDPSQMIEIIFNEQDSKAIVKYKGEPKHIVDLEEIYQDFLTDRDNVMFDLAMNELFDESGKFDATRFFKKAVKSLITSGADPQTIKVFESVENGVPVYNPNIGITKEQFTNLLFAHITKGILQQKVSGDAMAHVSSYGVKPVKEIRKIKIGDKFDYTWELVGKANPIHKSIAHGNTPYTKLDLENNHPDQIIYDPTLETDVLRTKLKELYESGNIYFTDELRHLKPRYNYVDFGTEYDVVDGILGNYTESLMPASRLTDQGVTQDNKYSFGVRIPSQDKHSAVNVEWVDLLPMFYGNTIITAKEIVFVSGSDFDVDKLFIHKPELYRVVNTWVAYGTGNKEREYIEFLRDSNSEFNKRYTQIRKTLLENDEEMDQYYKDLKSQIAVLRTERKETKDRDVKADITSQISSIQEEVDALDEEYALGDAYVREQLKLQTDALIKEMRLPKLEGFKNPYAINNELLELKQLALTNDGTLKSLNGNAAISKTPATMTSMQELDKGDLFQEDGRSIFSQMDNMPAHIFKKHSTVHTKNNTGKENINPYVNGNLGLIAAIRAGYEINKDWRIKINRHQIKEFKPLSSEGQRIFDILSTLISSATDEAKEQLNARFHLSVDGAALVKTMISLGYSLQTSILFANQPIVQKRIKEKQDKFKTIYLESEYVPDMMEMLPTMVFYEGTYGDVDLVDSIKYGSDLLFDNRILRDLDVFEKIDKQLSLITRFLKVKKGFVDGLDQLDQLNDAVRDLGFDLPAKKYKNFMENNPINTHLTFKDNGKKLKQIENVYQNILPRVDSMATELLFSRSPIVTYLKRNVFDQLKTSNRDAIESINRDIDSYIFVRAYLQEQDVDVSLFTENLFVKGDHSTVGDTLTRLKQDVYRIQKEGAVTPDEELLQGLYGTSILKRLTTKENKKYNIDELKLDTFAKLSIEQQDTLITSYALMIKNLSYLSDDKIEYKTLPQQMFAYWIMKDGFQNKFGNIAKLFPMHMFKIHSNTIDKIMSGVNIGEYLDPSVYADILKRIGESSETQKYLKDFYTKNTEGKAHTGHVVDFRILKKESEGRINYPFKWDRDNNVTDIPFYLKVSSSTVQLNRLLLFDGTVLERTQPNFYNSAIETNTLKKVVKVEYINLPVKDIPYQSIMTTDLNFVGNSRMIGENIVSLDSQVIENQGDMNSSNYINYSGAAKGADTVWETLGKEFGIGKQVNYRPEDLKKANPDNLKQIEAAYIQAAKDLGRKTLSADSFAGGLVRRDYLQALSADAVFAISTILEPGQKDKKGFKNNTGKQVVEGGTGYAVQMAINLNKPVFVYDQIKEDWFTWSGNTFVKTGVPSLTRKYSGVGTREINDKGKQAIRDVYEKTFLNKEENKKGCDNSID